MIPSFCDSSKDQLQADVQMRLGHAVVILLGRIARGAEIPDHLPRFDLGAELDARLIRVALAQMRIIIGAFPIKAADAQPPAAILIPAVGLYDPPPSTATIGVPIAPSRSLPRCRLR